MIKSKPDLCKLNWSAISQGLETLTVNEWDTWAEQKNLRARPAFQAATIYRITAHLHTTVLLYTPNLCLFKSWNTLAFQHWDSRNLTQAFKYLYTKGMVLTQSILTPAFLELRLQNGPAVTALTPNSKNPSSASPRRFKHTQPSVPGTELLSLGFVLPLGLRQEKKKKWRLTGDRKNTRLGRLCNLAATPLSISF